MKRTSITTGHALAALHPGRIAFLYGPGGLTQREIADALAVSFEVVRNLFIGFMDNRTPCRVRNGADGVPWFRLDRPLMDHRKGRCFSGPPSQKAYVADSREKADRLFLWYAIQSDFEANPYPLWADPMEVWAPNVPQAVSAEIRRLTHAIVFADNECVETYFPANNPVKGAPELWAHNPFSPNDPTSWWNINAAKLFEGPVRTVADRLVRAVLGLYAKWRKLFVVHARLPIDVKCDYYIGHASVSASSGLDQIKGYIDLKDDADLMSAWRDVQEKLKEAKEEFHRLLVAADGINYFGDPSIAKSPSLPPDPMHLKKSDARDAAAEQATRREKGTDKERKKMVRFR